MTDINQAEYNRRVLTCYFKADEEQWLLSERIKLMAIRNDSSVSEEMAKILGYGFKYMEENGIIDGDFNQSVNQAKIDTLQAKIDALRNEMNG